MDYDSLTDQINNAVTSTGTSWEPVVGGLDKVSSSAMGFAWGMGNNRVWVCQLPCQGNWKEVEFPGTVRDVITDDYHVYVLSQDHLATKLANNTDEWVLVGVPADITKIISTGSYIWGQAGDNKYRLAKPGVTGDWRRVQDPLNIKITSASSGHLYGVGADGSAMVTDESMQSAWSVIPEIGGKYSTIIGDADQTAIYGIDSTNSLRRCMNGKCTGVDTQGYTPQAITIDPTSQALWMTTSNASKSGNIFTQPLTGNYADLLKKVQPLDEKRDQIVEEAVVQGAQSQTTEELQKTYEMVQEVFRKLFGMKPVVASEADEKRLKDNIDSNNAHANAIYRILPFIQGLLIVLALTIAVYALGDLFGSSVHLVAFTVFFGGMLAVTGVFINISYN